MSLGHLYEQSISKLDLLLAGSGDPHYFNYIGLPKKMGILDSLVWRDTCYRLVQPLFH